MTNEEAKEHLKDILADVPNDKCIDWIEALNQAIKALEQARPKGKWIDSSEEDSYYANCSHCGYQIDTHYERGYLNYCPDCGADMEVENESNN